MIQWQRYLNGLAFLCIVLNVLEQLRIFRRYGQLISSITTVISGMFEFIIILFAATTAFAGSFFILSKNNLGSEDFLDSVRNTYELLLGAFDTSTFGKVGYPLVYGVFAVAALFLIVVMLNLLIAIISDSFAAVQEQRDRKMYQEFTELIFRHRHLIPASDKKLLDTQGNYLYIAQRSQTSGEDGGEAEERTKVAEQERQERRLEETTRRVADELADLKRVLMGAQQRAQGPMMGEAMN